MAIAKIVALLAITAVALEDAPIRRLGECGDDKTEDGCKCIMGCEVMGGDGGECSSDKKKNAEIAAKKMPTDTSDKTKMCDIMKCTAYCVKEMECGDKSGCEAYKKADTSCDVDCSGAMRSALPLSIFALILPLSILTQ